MDIQTVLVLSADLADPDLKLLAQLPPETNIAVGNSVEAFERLAADATVIFSWSAAGDLLRDVFAMCPKVRWVHSRSAGLDGVLFPALVESPVPLTNGRGVFSQSLGEFALGAILYFAKDFRRMNRNQEAGRWEPFDIVEISGQTVGILGYGDIGRAVASRVRPMGMRVLAVKRHGPSLYNADPLVHQIFPPDKRTEMLAQSDYVVAAAPLTPETRGMIGEAEFQAMKPRWCARWPPNASKAPPWTSSIPNPSRKAIHTTAWKTSCSPRTAPTTPPIGPSRECVSSCPSSNAFRRVSPWKTW